MTKGVVGKTGSTAPIAPSAKAQSPASNQKARAGVSIKAAIDLNT